MEQLKQVVERLEEGEVALEEAIQMFKEGMQLAKLCHDKLVHVEKQLGEILAEEEDFELIEIQEDFKD